MNLDLNVVMNNIGEYLSLYGLRVLGAIALFFVGKFAVKVVVGLIDRLLQKIHMDLTLRAFIRKVAYVLGLTLVVVAVLGQVGVETTSLIAVLGAAGLAVGLALQGSLSNLAAGMMIIALRPFKVGDYIEAAGLAGFVEDVSLFTTRLATPDNKSVVVPNSSITGGNIVNYMAKPSRRIDMIFGVSYNDDIRKVKNILKKIIDEDVRVLKDPAPQIAVSELADNSVNFVVRPWVKTEQYWDVRFDLIEKIKMTFDAEGIEIPFPQRVFHMPNNKPLEKLKTGS